MSRKKALLFGFIVLCACWFAMAAPAAPAQAWNPFKGRGVKPPEADPEKEYRLQETNGPWLVFVTAFSGPNANKDAKALVYELRKKYGYKAYMFEQTFVHDLNQERPDRPRHPDAPRENYRKKGANRQCAVLVGDFQSIEDNDVEKTIDGIKKCQPECMKNRPLFGTAQANAPGRGPFQLAFAVRNPIHPPDESARQGTVDAFIEKINSQRPYSLLKCPGRYSVKIATFTGRVEIKQSEIQDILAGKKPFQKGKYSELELGEKAAVELCRILRSKHIEAYEFHDRHASIVTVGSFQSYGRQRPDGTIELRPEIIEILNHFQGKPARAGIGAGTIAHEPVRYGGIECDVQPQIIEVPRRR